MKLITFSGIQKEKKNEIFCQKFELKLSNQANVLKEIYKISPIFYHADKEKKFFSPIINKNDKIKLMSLDLGKKLQKNNFDSYLSNYQSQNSKKFLLLLLVVQKNLYQFIKIKTMQEGIHIEIFMIQQEKKYKVHLEYQQKIPLTKQIKIMIVIMRKNFQK